MAKRINGKDFYKEITNPKTKKPLKTTYWDLWIAIVLVKYWEGDWDKLIDSLRRKTKRDFSLPYDFEALANHIRLLHQTLEDAGLGIEDILADADADFLKKQEKKAYSRVLEMEFESNEKSKWMIYTPRKIREVKALRGHWDKFPVDPEEYANSLEKRYKSKGYYSENQSFGLEEKLSAFIKKQESRASLARRFALYRAFLTVVVEKMNIVDDSFGVIGELYQEVFQKYYHLDRTKFDMQPSDFFQDFLELLIWEDYGFTDEKQPDFFASLTSSEIPVAESILQQQWEELSELEIEYQAEEALTMLGMLNVQHQCFDKFVSLAQIMGSRHWKRITSMAEMAEKHQQYDLAFAVYEACLQPGEHKKFLSEKYNKLKRRLRAKE